MNPARVLAADTSGDSGGLALVDSEGRSEQEALESAGGFAHLLFDRLEWFLARCGRSLRDVHCFAAAAGPGSFTGVRVALSAMKGLAETTGKPLVAVSSLQALAWYGTASLRAVLLDARRGEIYGAVYDSALHLVSSEMVTRLEPWLDSLPAGDVELISPHGRRLIAAPPVKLVEAPPSLASAVAHIALDRFLAGTAPDPCQAEANYVRRADAELPRTGQERIAKLETFDSGRG